MARLVLIDTVDQLPGLLPIHGWSALMSSDLVVVGAADHPFLPQLDLAELRHEVLPAHSGGGAGLSRTELLSGLSPANKRRAELLVDRASAEGEVAYLFGPADDEAFTRTLGMEAARAGVEVEVVYFMLAPKGTALLELTSVMERLRAPGGCPWDREQTHATLAQYAVEEVYELLEAIEGGGVDAIREELGDVLLQVVFHAQIAQENGDFTIDEVAKGIADKLVHRHPHVFSDTAVADADEVVANWEELKARERRERTSRTGDGFFEGIPGAMPALQYVHKLQSRAAGAGFDWVWAGPGRGPKDNADAAERVRLELEEFLAAENLGERRDELGDLLMSVVGLARRHKIDPEGALRGAARRFRERFDGMLAVADRPPEELSREEWLALWERVKQ